MVVQVKLEAAALSLPLVKATVNFSRLDDSLSARTSASVAGQRVFSAEADVKPRATSVLNVNMADQHWELSLRFPGREHKAFFVAAKRNEDVFALAVNRSAHREYMVTVSTPFPG
jgi:hypothetical protein